MDSTFDDIKSEVTQVYTQYMYNRFKNQYLVQAPAAAPKKSCVHIMHISGGNLLIQGQLKKVLYY